MKTLMRALGVLFLLTLGYQFLYRYQYVHLQGGQIERIDRLTGQICRVITGYTGFSHPALPKQTKNKRWEEPYSLTYSTLLNDPYIPPIDSLPPGYKVDSLPPGYKVISSPTATPAHTTTDDFSSIAEPIHTATPAEPHGWTQITPPTVTPPQKPGVEILTTEQTNELDRSICQ